MSQKRQIFKLNVLKKLLTEENSCVSLVQSTRLLALPPFFLNDMKSGILYQLNTMLKKYDRSLGGIVIGYQNIKLLMDENTGIIPIGTSETEVNISLEFYIFQPKIGSYLEGVINKKSNTHIGCLVHQYFNATILKPEDIPCEEWTCKNFNVDDRIIFKVKDLDFTTLLPYIEGNYDGAQLVNVKLETSAHFDTNEMTSVDTNTGCLNELCNSKEIRGGSNLSDDGDRCILSDKKDLKSNEVFVKKKSSANNTIEGNDTLGDLGKTKKKKKKKGEKHILTAHDNHIMESKGEESSNERKLNLDRNNKELKVEENITKKKKKKKKRTDESKESPESPVVNIKKSESLTNVPCDIYKNLLEDEDSNDFVKTIKSKKESKKRKHQNEKSTSKFNAENEYLPSQDVEDNVFYSTQLEPSAESKKMRISFCSPIPRSAHSENQPDSPDGLEKEKKKKHKKRKKEKTEEPEYSPPAKKSKITSDLPSLCKEVNDDERNSLLKFMMEQLCRQQLNRVREELNMSSSDKESIKEDKKKKKELKKSKREEKHPKDLKENDGKSQVNGNDKKSAQVQSMLEKLWKEQLERVKEELSTSDRESFKESKKTKMKEEKKKDRRHSKEWTKEALKKVTNTQSNSTKEDETKSEKQNMIDKMYRQEIHRVKEEFSKSDTDNVKEKKKKKSSISKPETTKKETQNSLYDRLLNEARSTIEIEKDTSSILPTTEFEKRKKDTELSNSFKKKESRKKMEKSENYHQTPDRCKNGSMYDVLPTPEVVNPDKSLFSDSEQSHLSPIKKSKTINGESKKSAVQNLLDEFYKEESKKLKSDSRKGSERKSKKKSRGEQTKEEESLYEKLLKEAKNLIDIKEESSSGKKGKKKKHKMAPDCVKT